MTQMCTPADSCNTCSMSCAVAAVDSVLSGAAAVRFGFTASGVDVAGTTTEPCSCLPSAPPCLHACTCQAAMTSPMSSADPVLRTQPAVCQHEGCSFWCQAFCTNLACCVVHCRCACTWTAGDCCTAMQGCSMASSSRLAMPDADATPHRLLQAPGRRCCCWCGTQPWRQPLQLPGAVVMSVAASCIWLCSPPESSAPCSGRRRRHPDAAAGYLLLCMSSRCADALKSQPARRCWAGCGVAPRQLVDPASQWHDASASVICGCGDYGQCAMRPARSSGNLWCPTWRSLARDPQR
jgi:hypothetical protein